MSVFAFLPVIFYKNVFVFLDLVVFCKSVLSYFKKLYASVNTSWDYSMHAWSGNTLNIKDGHCILIYTSIIQVCFLRKLVQQLRTDVTSFCIQFEKKERPLGFLCLFYVLQAMFT